jgi:hypothetical protein
MKITPHSSALLSVGCSLLIIGVAATNAQAPCYTPPSTTDPSWKPGAQVTVIFDSKRQLHPGPKKCDTAGLRELE